jgi:hypothetical protein
MPGTTRRNPQIIETSDNTSLLPVLDWKGLLVVHTQLRSETFQTPFLGGANHQPPCTALQDCTSTSWTVCENSPSIQDFKMSKMVLYRPVKDFGHWIFYGLSIDRTLGPEKTAQRDSQTIPHTAALRESNNTISVTCGTPVPANIWTMDLVLLRTCIILLIGTYGSACSRLCLALAWERWRLHSIVPSS